MSRPTLKRLSAFAPAVALLVALLWMWRVSDPVHNLPTKPEYGDPLEVLWLIDFTAQSLAEGRLPLFSPDVWHPVGIYLGALGYAPLSYAITLPLRLVSTATLAYNAVTLIGLALIYATTFRLARRFAEPLPAAVGALLFAFTPFTVERVLNGHVNILLGTIFLPPLLGALLDMVNAEDARTLTRASVKAGAWWGGLITFQLYGVWWGGLMWGITWLVTVARSRRMHGLAAVPVALALGAPWLALYAGQSRMAQLVTDAIPALVGWGASVNSLPIPSIFHPIDAVRAFATAVYAGIQNESGIANWGAALTAVASAGAVSMWRARRLRPEAVLLMAIAATAAVLALGPAVKWDGHPVRAPLLAPLNDAIWQLGRLTKPALFVPDRPVPELADALTAPGYLLMALLPQWESARVYTRFSMLTGLVMALMAAWALGRMRGRLAPALAALLLVEVLPLPTFDRPTPTAAHPAYDWLAANAAPGRAERMWNILDISDEPNIVPVLLGGLPTYAAALGDVAISSGFGSYPVKHLAELRTHLLRAPEWAGDVRTPYFLRNLRIGYVLVHRIFRKDDRVWAGVSASPHFAVEGCFASRGASDVWAEEICVARARWLDAPSTAPAIDMVPSYDWSSEAWGVWAIAQRATANWLAARPTDHRLTLRAFPACVPGRFQSMQVSVNGVRIGEHRWSECAESELVFGVPAAAVRPGWNDVAFDFGFAENVSGDSRTLAVGFTHIAFGPTEAR